MFYAQLANISAYVCRFWWIKRYAEIDFGGKQLAAGAKVLQKIQDTVSAAI